MWRQVRWLAPLLLSLPALVVAGEVSEDFSSVERKDAGGSLVWNIPLQKLHPQYQVWAIDPIGATPPGQTRALDVGDGSHGVFDNTTYANFDADGDSDNSVIVINTDDYPEGLKVTSFTLDNGMTLSATGSEPLTILSQSTITVNGTIDCSGADGLDSTLVATDSLAGGSGRCGGASGGATGGVGFTGGSTTGGAGGVAGGGAGGNGGGGGGAHTLTGTLAADGDNPNAGAQASGGANDASDELFEVLEGGSGGGGGSADPGVSSGASGGAGGGVIWMVASSNINIGANGFILANGGAGGGGTDAGGGGGGGGGSIAIFSGGAYYNGHTGVAAVSAVAGSGGVTTGSDNDGGDGAPGRTWIVDGTGGPDGVGGSLEDPGNFYTAEGDMQFVDSAELGITKAIDLGNTNPEVTLVTVDKTTTGAATILVEVASGAEEDFDPSSSWVDASTLVGTKLSRYVRVRATIDVAAQGEVAYLNSVSFAFDESEITDFELSSACGSVSGGNTSPFAIVLLLIPLLIALNARLNPKVRGMFG